MKFEIPGLTLGPTDTDLERLERSQLVVRPPSEGLDEAAQAAALGLTLAQWRAFQASLESLRQMA
ncbi:hypothetical protein ACFP81_10080 [Deinococcus lacus]|uniref:Uncharacterized protein n=1 Tax=Deinococcus lacus TaxID=392561 RepID=A0ABW1YE67_9DEIO